MSADPAAAQALVAQGLDHHQAGRHAEAERTYAQALAIDPDEASGLYLLGLLAFETGRAAQAAILLQRVADLHPRNIEARITLARIRHWLGEIEAAIAGYRAVLDIDEGHVEARINLANALRDVGELEAALDAARAAVARHHDVAAARSAFAAILVATGQPLAGASAYRDAIRLEPLAVASHVGLALALLQAGEPAAALRAADRAVELDPVQADGWFAEGAALSALHRHVEAAQVLEQCLTLDPKRPAALLALGTTYAELEQVAEAERRLQAAIALDPRMAEAHASLGAVYLMADKPALARASYERALAIDPKMIAAHQSLAGLTADVGEAAQARRHRDAAYRQQNLFVSAAPDPASRVLILSTAEGGNVPFQYLLPRDRYTRLTWFIEYATPGQAAELPAHDVVFNAIGDADLAGPTAANVAAFLAVNDKPLLNDPSQVARTARHLTPALLDGLADVVVPPTTRIFGRDLPSARPAFPVLVRPIGSHGGKGLVRVGTADALAAVDLKPDAEAYLTAYQDFASADGLYRKYRMIFVGRRAFPYHLAISNDWLVHHGSAGMAGDAARIAEELAFLRDPAMAIGARAMAAVEAIGRRLDLDYAGLDFTVLPDGQVLVFEANATMLVHPERPGSPFAHKNPYVETILDAFQAMVAGPQTL